MNNALSLEKNLCSINDVSIKGTIAFCMMAVAEEGKEQAHPPGVAVVSGRRINWTKATKQPWTPGVPGDFIMLHKVLKKRINPQARKSARKRKTLQVARMLEMITGTRETARTNKQQETKPRKITILLSATQEKWQKASFLFQVKGQVTEQESE